MGKPLKLDLKKRAGLTSDLVRIAVLGGSRALAAAIGFLAVWQIADRLSPQALGVWSMGLAAFGFALHLSECGLRSVVTAEAGSHGLVHTNLLHRYLHLRLRLALTLSALSIVIIALIWPDYRMLAGLFLIAVIAVASHLDWIALVHDQVLAAAGCLIVRPVIFVLALWWIPALDTPVLIALVFAVAWWVSAIVSWPLGLMVKPNQSAPPANLIRLGLPLMGNTLVNQLQLSLDLLLIGWIAGAAMAGQYYLAAAIAAAGLVFANATGQIATARMARLRDDPGSFGIELRRQLKLSMFLAIALSIGLITLAPWVMYHVFDNKFDQVTTLLIFLMPWFAAAGISAHLQGALTANRGQALINKGNCVLLAVLIPTLVLACIWAQPWCFALARGMAEISRLIVLICGSQVFSVPTSNQIIRQTT